MPRENWPVACVALTFALALFGCSPTLRGRCTSDVDCRDGAVCAAGGICISASGTCAPACVLGQLCSSGSCTPLNASVAVRLPANALLGPQRPQLAVQVAAAPGVTAGTLVVEVARDATHLEAMAALASPQQGLNTLTLGGFDGNYAGPVTVLATLPFIDAAGNAGKAQSLAVAALYDSQAPLVTVFVPPQDSVGGWFPRAGPDLEIRAQVDDQGGSGPASASLTFSTCPPSSACTVPGTLLSSAAQGMAIFSFLVPRAVQRVAFEVPIAFTVRAVDQAGNAGTGVGALQIDDKAPAIGSATLVTKGTLGEDGKAWFRGGPSGLSVEISVTLSDSGAGVDPSTVALLLNPADVDPTATLRIPATLPLPGDGTAHFTVSTTVASGREGPVHFSVVAQDKLQHLQNFTPGSAILFVDDLAPTVRLAHVDYAGAQPPFSSVCAVGVLCGRGPSTTPDHLLRDDSATVTFDAFDCGAGLGAPAQPGFTAMTSAMSVNGTVNETPTSASTCTSGNAVHHYNFQLRLPEHVPALDPSDLSGNTVVQLIAHSIDRLGNQTDQGPGTSSTDGFARVSLVRWHTQLAHLPSGAGALLPGASPRRLVLGTAGPSGTANLFAYGPDGSVSFQATVVPAIAGDLAVGPSGTIYAVSGAQTCGGTTCSTFNWIPTPANGTTTATPLAPCTVSGIGLSAPPSIFPAVAGTTPERAVAVATFRNNPSSDNVYLFDSGTKCTRQASTLIIQNSASSIGELTGVSGSASNLFASHSDGFTSLGLSGVNFGGPQTQIQYDSASDVPATKAPPALSFTQGTSPVLQPIFASAASDQRVRATTQQLACPSNPGMPCWTLANGFLAPAAAAGFSSTPVFDGVSIYATDDLGGVSAWSQISGALQGKIAYPPAASAPVILDGAPSANPLLVVAADGKVHLVAPHPSGADQVLVQVGAFMSAVTPLPPAVDRRDLRSLAGAVIALGGVAYVADGAGFIWALQLPKPPLPASDTAWPRPGRDSCNSRNLAAGSSCP